MHWFLDLCYRVIRTNFCINCRPWCGWILLGIKYSKLTPVLRFSAHTDSAKSLQLCIHIGTRLSHFNVSMTYWVSRSIILDLSHSRVFLCGWMLAGLVIQKSSYPSRHFWIKNVSGFWWNILIEWSVKGTREINLTEHQFYQELKNILKLDYQKCINWFSTLWSHFHQLPASNNSYHPRYRVNAGPNRKVLFHRLS